MLPASWAATLRRGKGEEGGTSSAPDSPHPPPSGRSLTLKPTPWARPSGRSDDDGDPGGARPAHRGGLAAAPSHVGAASPSLTAAPHYVTGPGVGARRPAGRGTVGADEPAAGQGGPSGGELSPRPRRQSGLRRRCTQPSGPYFAEVARAAPGRHGLEPLTPHPSPLPENPAPRPGHGALLARRASRVTRGGGTDSPQKRRVLMTRGRNRFQEGKNENSCMLHRYGRIIKSRKNLEA